jgi:hypothetical protein
MSIMHLPHHLRHAKHREPHNGCAVCMHKVAKVEAAAARIAEDISERIYGDHDISRRRSLR